MAAKTAAQAQPGNHSPHPYIRERQGRAKADMHADEHDIGRGRRGSRGVGGDVAPHIETLNDRVYGRQVRDESRGSLSDTMLEISQALTANDTQVVECDYE